MHRDIKPANILFKRKLNFNNKALLKEGLSNLCIVDFGLAAIINTKNAFYLKCGTPGYLAPELVDAKKISDYN